MNHIGGLLTPELERLARCEARRRELAALAHVGKLQQPERGVRSWSTHAVRLVLECLEELMLENHRDVLTMRAVLRRELERREEGAERRNVPPALRQEASNR